MKQKFYNKQAGLTLIELMIALVLGLLLVAGTIQVFISNKQTARVTEAHGRLQENARFALEVLTKSIRAAGYSGCRTVERLKIQTIANAPLPADLSTKTIISGTDDWSLGVDANLGTVVAGTDVISVQHGTTCGGSLATAMTSSNAQIKIVYPNSCNIHADDVLMISDCTDAHIFRSSNKPPTPSSGEQTITHAITSNKTTHLCTSYPDGIKPGACSSTDVEKKYGTDSELLKFSTMTYFIRLNPNSISSLYAYDGSSSSTGDNPLELVEGIENLQVMYGVDENDDFIVDSYKKASAVEANDEWDRVESVQISILAQTVETNLTTTPQSIVYNGSNIDGTDGRIRRVFSTTIAIRNRLQ